MHEPQEQLNSWADWFDSIIYVNTSGWFYLLLKHFKSLADKEEKNNRVVSKEHR